MLSLSFEIITKIESIHIHPHTFTNVYSTRRSGLVV